MGLWNLRFWGGGGTHPPKVWIGSPRGEWGSILYTISDYIGQAKKRRVFCSSPTHTPFLLEYPPRAYIVHHFNDTELRCAYMLGGSIKA